MLFEGNVAHIFGCEHAQMPIDDRVALGRMLTPTPVGETRPRTYNPRKTDPKRLEIMELSLRKLGFLIPIYADASGEVISGHQRLLVRGRMGVEKVPWPAPRRWTFPAGKG